MTWRVIHTSKAERDIGSAASWYENQKHHLGHEFLDEILAVEDSLSQHPSIYPVMHKDIRSGHKTLSLRSLFCYQEAYGHHNSRSSHAPRS